MPSGSYNIPQGATQLPDLGTTTFADMQEANAYLEAPVWKPSIGTYGFPQSSGDHFKCVAKIQNAIVDLRDVRDKNSNPHEIQKFRLGGAWSNPKDVKAISSAVFDAIMNIHKIRLMGIAH